MYGLFIIIDKGTILVGVVPCKLNRMCPLEIVSIDWFVIGREPINNVSADTCVDILPLLLQHPLPALLTNAEGAIKQTDVCGVHLDESVLFDRPTPKVQILVNIHLSSYIYLVLGVVVVYVTSICRTTFCGDAVTPNTSLSF